MNTIVNLTPHPLNVAGFTIPASGTIARVSVTRRQTASLTLADGSSIPAFVPEFGQVTGLPPAQDGTIFIVSAMVRSHPAVQPRIDVASPGQLLRDDAGQIVGCDGLDFNVGA